MKILPQRGQRWQVTVTPTPLVIALVIMTLEASHLAQYRRNIFQTTIMNVKVR